MFDIWTSTAELHQPCLYRALSDRMMDESGCVKKEILSSVDRILCEHLAFGRASFQIPPSPPPMVAEHRFLNVSALQKSIRRGDAASAMRYAQQGCGVDAEHIFRRLAVCAVEDVGIGNLLAVGMALAVMGNKTLRQNGAPDELAAYLAYLLAISPKSRLACDLLSICDYDRTLKSWKSELAATSEVNLRRHSENRQLPTADRMTAAWLLAGTTRFRGTTMPKVGRPRPAVMQMMAASRMPVMLYYIADRGAARLSDAMFVSTYFVWEMIKADPNIAIIGNGLSGVAVIDGFPAPTFDMHTYEGRIAIGRLSRECLPVAALLRAISPSLRDTAIRHAVFQVEGGQLNEQVRFDTADGIENQARAAELAYAGLIDCELRQQLRAAVIDTIPYLNAFRSLEC